jgi:hypothetical protein
MTVADSRRLRYLGKVHVPGCVLAGSCAVDRGAAATAIPTHPTRQTHGRARRTGVLPGGTHSAYCGPSSTGVARGAWGPSGVGGSRQAHVARARDAVPGAVSQARGPAEGAEGTVLAVHRATQPKTARCTLDTRGLRSSSGTAPSRRRIARSTAVSGRQPGTGTVSADGAADAEVLRGRSAVGCPAIVLSSNTWHASKVRAAGRASVASRGNARGAPAGAVAVLACSEGMERSER